MNGKKKTSKSVCRMHSKMVDKNEYVYIICSYGAKTNIHKHIGQVFQGD